MYIGLSILYMLHSLAAFLLCRSRYSKKKTALICAGVAAFQIVILFCLPSPDRSAKWSYPMFVLAFVVSLTQFLFLSDENISQTLFVFLTYSQVFLILLFLSRPISTAFFSSDDDAAMWIRTVMHLIVLLVYAAFFKEKVDDFRKEFTQGWKPMVFMSALYSIYIAYISMVAQVNLKKTELLIFVLLLAVMVTGYGVIFQTIYYMKKSTLNVQIERQQKMLEQKLEIMQKAEEETKRLLHDIRHHMANIAEYARNRQYEPLLAYLEQYGEEIEKTRLTHVCANPVIDNILMVFARQAEQNSIALACDIDVEYDTGIRDVDMVAILANLMENAIHGCLNSGKSRMQIEVRIRSKEGKLTILVRNTCKDEIPGEGEQSDTLEKEGIGMSSIRRSAGRYRGDADFKSQGGVFTSRIILIRAEEEKQ